MISIIIPFYNTEKYIEQCLESVKSQTFSNYEVLMIDDGSTDKSRSIAERYSKEDSRFKLLNKEHVGFPQAKNIGLDNAKGEYICFLDSDDYLESEYLEFLLKGLLESNTDICCCAFRCFTEGSPIKPLSETEFKIKVYEEERMQILFSASASTFMWNKIYKREIFEGLRFADVEALSDTILCPFLFENAKSISTINKYLIYHRKHNENMTYHVRNESNTYWEHRLRVYLFICYYLIKEFPKYKNNYKKIFEGELYFIKPHLTEELFNVYLNDIRVKELLEG